MGELLVALKFAEHGLDEAEGFEQLLPCLGAGENNLTTDKDQHYEFRLLQPVDQTREQLGVVLAEVEVLVRQALQTYWEL